MINDLPELLRRWRSARGATQEEVAEAVGVSKYSYQKWEYGKAAPHGFNLNKLIEYFGVDRGDINASASACADEPRKQIVPVALLSEVHPGATSQSYEIEIEIELEIEIEIEPNPNAGASTREGAPALREYYGIEIDRAHDYSDFREDDPGYHVGDIILVEKREFSLVRPDGHDCGVYLNYDHFNKVAYFRYWRGGWTGDMLRPPADAGAPPAYKNTVFFVCKRLSAPAGASARASVAKIKRKV